MKTQVRSGMAAGAAAEFSIHTKNFLQLLIDDIHHTTVMLTPVRIFAGLLAEVAARAIELDDPILNSLMVKLTLFEQSDPESKSYNKDMLEEVRRLAPRKVSTRFKLGDDVEVTGGTSRGRCGVVSQVFWSGNLIQIRFNNDKKDEDTVHINHLKKCKTSKTKESPEPPVSAGKESLGKKCRRRKTGG